MSAQTSADIIAALKKKWNTGAHAWLEQVRNGTGYRAKERYADALVVSCWPSRGIWIAGVEVKVSRGDWLRELKAPEKSAPIQKYCKYWWVATPPDVVQPDELPETWGLIEVRGKTKTKTVKQAPELAPDPLDPSFVASVLRNAEQSQATAAAMAVRDAHERWKEEHAKELAEVEKFDELRSDFDDYKSKMQPLDELAEELRRVGVSLRYNSGERLARLIELGRRVEALEEIQLDHIKKRFQKAVDAIEAAQGGL